MERKTILIVEKDGKERQKLDQFLMLEYDIVLADDGRQALSEVQKRINELAAVILDWDISVVSAYQILQVMHTKGMTKDIQVFVTTHEADFEIDSKICGLGARAVIH
ncbi:MAG: hypothetical protein K2H45_01105, partial [Acetatifactor sp.]|nr:hypothetical protein [Acetatifactor sp.]